MEVAERGREALLEFTGIALEPEDVSQGNIQASFINYVS
jgi:hypothetical protein